LENVLYYFGFDVERESEKFGFHYSFCFVECKESNNPFGDADVVGYEARTNWVGLTRHMFSEWA